MKQILRLNILDTDICVMQADCSEQELLDLCAEKNIATDDLSGIKAESRRKEKLCTRLILAKMLNGAAEIGHKDSGAPYLKGRNEQISVSHSGSFAAVALSSNPGTGIDIEIIKDRILKVRERVFSESELNTMPADDAESNLIGWTSKEALFKAIPEGDIDFREHLHLQIPETAKRNEIIRHTASETVSPRHDSFDMATIITGEFVLTLAKTKNSI